ncbi:AEC family transporter [Piscinibacter sakaiensis]|uniref:AEC family transporter n=1 Tax=Piscinibacter sakaiensis TaxID=1547922 RepID=UPI003729F944
MSLVLLTKLLAIVAIVALGYLVGRARWLSPDDRDGDPARTLSYAAFYIFVPALLLRTTARIDLAALPWRTLAAFFLPVVAVMGAVYLLQRRRPQARQMPAAPSVRALSCVFGNTVQVGVPLSAALFGEAGLALHVTLVSLHALTLPQPSGPPARNTLVHPVVLPVLAGLAWNLGGLGIPGPVDEVLATLGAAVVPLCLVLIGMSLAYYDVGGAWRAAAGISVVKLLLLPALVLAVGHGLFGLRGLPLAVITVAAALPAGSNALLFAQRYDTLQAEASAAIVVSTLAFALTVPAWLAVLAALGALG